MPPPSDGCRQLPGVRRRSSQSTADGPADVGRTAAGECRRRANRRWWVPASGEPPLVVPASGGPPLVGTGVG
ncbi:hypothetical protein J2790_000342 [Paenarthrobacter nicotinovorans]|uniref:hypothetical protein n=1 Tax=Micrococcaceae TaxID=1268 RepID=UPI001113B921|nr:MULTISPECIES: hypothetical protein [Micrococcaceae]MDR6435221.1 hypothetical protein [Paenarthrobacter nicotinovorans]